MIKGKLLLSELRQASDANDQVRFRSVVDEIQRLVHGESKISICPMSDHDIQMLLDRSPQTCIGGNLLPVGTGTCGQRIYINLIDGVLSMTDDTYGQKYRDRFRALFDLTKESEARVSF